MSFLAAITELLNDLLVDLILSVQEARSASVIGAALLSGSD
jgi:hypothetical protein